MRAIPVAADLNRLELFDSCISLGRIVHSKYPESLDVRSAIAMMDRYHIAEALVHEHHARTTYPREHGNRRLSDGVAGEPRLHPVWVIEPPKKPGRQPSVELVDGMLNADVKTARLHMKKAPPMAWMWEDLLGVLEEHRIPCFLDFGDVSTLGAMSDSDVDGVREMALAHPELPMVLSGVFGGLGVHPAVVPLILRVPNLYIDIAGILEYWRAVAGEVGPERVLFSTCAPFVDPGIYVSNIQYAHGFKDTEKRQMCGGNLRRLLEGVR